MPARVVFRQHGRRMKRDYLTTFVAEALVLASALLAYRLVALHYSTSGFAEYAVARRALTLLLPFGVIGLDVGIARLVAYAADKRPQDARGYLMAALPISITGLALASAALLGFAPLFAQLFFGDVQRVDLVATLPLLLGGATAHVLVYGNLRGNNRIAQANLMMVVNHAILPVATVVLGGSLQAILLGLGAGWLVFSVAVFVVTPKEAHDVGRLARELLRFGGRRMPGDLVQILFFALPVIITAQLGGLTDAGIVAFGITALGMVGSSLTPISFVLLPVASRLIGRGSVAGLRAHVVGIVRRVTPVMMIGILAVEVFAEEIIRRYLGPDFVPAVGTLRLILLGALPWTAFIVLRSILDARHERAVNSRNLAIGFAVFVIVAAPAALLARSTTIVLSGFVTGLFVLAILTIVESYRALQDPAQSVLRGAPQPSELSELH
jgi:O-antigen/teichoic acid export membrane protein